MTKKTTINKIVSSKAFWIIISLLASFLLWTYIMSTEETTIERTFSNVKVVYQGADDLRATRGLIVTGADADTVSVRLKGTRRVLGNLSSADLSAVIDVSGISQAREMQVSYSLQYPTNVDKSSITVLSKSPETISFSVVQEANKTLEVKGVFTGSVKDGYTAEPIQVDPSSITLYGPQEELDAVDSICVYVTRTDLDKSIAFYEEALGLHEVRRNEAADGSYKIVYMGNEVSNFQLELTWMRDHPQKYDLGECEFHLAFRVDDYPAAYEKHSKMGCVCYGNEAMGVYFINDPDGYWLEICPYRNRK